MMAPSYTLLYVTDPMASAEFYSRLLGQQPVEVSATFALFVLNSGLKLGLWKREGVEPAATASGGGSELAIALANRAAVDEVYEQWDGQGIPVLQSPTAMDFGYTFVVADPDQHRLRIFSPEGE